MNYADLELGTWYPDGGMNALAAALEKIALKEGVKFHFNTPIEEVAVENERANGLLTKDGHHSFDAIVGGFGLDEKAKTSKNQHDFFSLLKMNIRASQFHSANHKTSMCFRSVPAEKGATHTLTR